MYSVSIILLVCLEISFIAVAYRPVTNPKRSHSSRRYMRQFSSPVDNMQRRIKAAVAAVVIAASTIDVPLAFADAPTVPVTRSVLEQSIQTLEASSTRSEVIQSLADVFEAAGSKTLLVRTKYKYVSSSREPYFSLFQISG